MKLNAYPLFKALSCLVLVVFACSYQKVSALCQDLSFDNLFPITLYKTALDETMALYGDVQALGETIIDHSLYVDATVGRMVRLIGHLDKLSAYQNQTHAHLQEDGAYLLMVLGHLHTIYQSATPTHIYPYITQLFEQACRQLTQAFAL